MCFINIFKSKCNTRGDFRNKWCFYVINNFSQGQTQDWPMAALLISVLLDMNKNTIYYTKDQDDFLEKYT